MEGTRMRISCISLALIAVISVGCDVARPQQSRGRGGVGTSVATPHNDPPGVAARADAQQVAEIKSLIEQLVFSEEKATEDPIITPGATPQSEQYRDRFEACRSAFQRLSEFKELAFPFLLEHLNDDRQSIPFRNHYTGQSVGAACYWNIYYQLQDMPDDYSSYGYKREGRDRKYHVKPYWEGTPFDDAGGLVKWLGQNRDRSYAEKQIRCLMWLLSREKAIGACDADSYFENILPLEIRILERRLEQGEDVAQDLARLRRIKSERLVEAIPGELLPDN